MKYFYHLEEFTCGCKQYAFGCRPKKEVMVKHVKVCKCCKRWARLINWEVVKEDHVTA